jgi:transposase, IS5 family
MVFTKFSIGDKLPDETTFFRFRNKLVVQNKYETLLKEINRQLEKHNLKVKQAPVAIVDATLITANARPNTVYKETLEGDLDKEQSKDADARWLKKGKKSHFGYQGFSRCDAEGFIEKTHVTPANLSEQKQLETMTEGLSMGVRVQTDKGFFSAENKKNLRDKGLKNGLMYRAFRNKPLTRRMKQFNKLISKTRYRIEQCFGTIKRRFGYQKASYFTTARVNGQFAVKAMCLNLLKACNKIQLV